MLRSIIIPLDGSELADKAVAVGASLARQHGIALQLIAVHPPAHGLSSVRLRPHGKDFAGLREAREEELATHLSRWRTALGGTGLVAVTTTLLEGSDSVGEQLVRHLQNSPDSLVVLTSHGRGAIGRLWYGSVADSLIRHADPACLVLHTGGGMRRRSPAHFDTLFLPLDGSPHAEWIVDPALMLAAGRPDPEVVLFHCVVPLRWPGPRLDPEDVGWTDVTIDERGRQAGRRLSAVADQVRAHGYRTRTLIRVSPHPAGAILAAAAEVGADVIAMALRQRPDGTRTIPGSVAKRVIHYATIPVVVVHSPAIVSGSYSAASDAAQLAATVTS